MENKPNEAVNEKDKAILEMISKKPFVDKDAIREEMKKKMQKILVKK